MRCVYAEVFCNRRLVWIELNTFVCDLESPLNFMEFILVSFHQENLQVRNLWHSRFH